MNMKRTNILVIASLLALPTYFVGCKSAFEAGVDEAGGGGVSGLGGRAPEVGGSMGLGVGGAAGNAGRVIPCSVTEFVLPTPESRPNGIIVGPDGNLWFAERDGAAPGTIGRISPDGAITEFPLPDPNSSNLYGVARLAVGPDGNIWYTGSYIGIGRIAPSGKILDPVASASAIPARAMTTGPDGNMWVTDEYGRIHRITPSGTITDFALPNVRADTEPYPHWQSITTGPDGNLWFTQFLLQRLGRMTPKGTETEFGMPDNGTPQFITAGPDGNLWFTAMAGAIGRITPHGIITEFPLLTQESYPAGIATGPDGNIWFTERDGNRIGYIAPSGAITECEPLAPNVPRNRSQTLPNGQVVWSYYTEPTSIVAGPDGNMWFTESSTNIIAHTNPSPSPPPVEPGPDGGAVDADPAPTPWGTCGEDYDMCGCGCCGGSTTSDPKRCYYASAGETVATVQAADQAARSSTNCSLVGCALPQRAVCCADLASNPGEVATYRVAYASWASSPPDITVTKEAAGVYAQLEIRRGTTTTDSGQDGKAYALGLPDGWGVKFAANLVSAYSAIPMNVFGAHGTVGLRASGSDCLLDIHATLFSTTLGTTGPSPLAGRLDADGIVVSFSGDAVDRTDFPVSACKF